MPPASAMALAWVDVRAPVARDDPARGAAPSVRRRPPPAEAARPDQQQRPKTACTERALNKQQRPKTACT
jgi:hypothetical protein